MNNQHRQRAKRLLAHYVRQASTKWDSDNDAEVCDIVDEIIAAVFWELTQAARQQTEATEQRLASEWHSRLADIA